MNAAGVLVFGSEVVPRLWLVPPTGTMGNAPEREPEGAIEGVNLMTESSENTGACKSFADEWLKDTDEEERSYLAYELKRLAGKFLPHTDEFVQPPQRLDQRKPQVKAGIQSREWLECRQLIALAEAVELKEVRKIREVQNNTLDLSRALHSFTVGKPLNPLKLGALMLASRALEMAGILEGTASEEEQARAINRLKRAQTLLDQGVEGDGGSGDA